MQKPGAGQSATVVNIANLKGTSLHALQTPAASGDPSASASSEQGAVPADASTADAPQCDESEPHLSANVAVLTGSGSESMAVSNPAIECSAKERASPFLDLKSPNPNAAIPTFGKPVKSIPVPSSATTVPPLVFPSDSNSSASDDREAQIIVPAAAKRSRSEDAQEEASTSTEGADGVARKVQRVANSSSAVVAHDQGGDGSTAPTSQASSERAEDEPTKSLQDDPTSASEQESHTNEAGVDEVAVDEHALENSDAGADQEATTQGGIDEVAVQSADAEECTANEDEDAQ